ncbi:DUF4124 domain-containing protein [Pseudoduganella sp. DS3]|uniref:DUF4124 domain-containing protein n=1 Tax=Pseudoduganella guangdongensis TaxID=2692179 RepID=A0A6N9HKZ7_9BURK|nr:DUF4124 domain-containing protein [Pseudoduganella guangdongensis]MYN04026.1 DUF4124 domain-containing protein [Pseudoduganella guangdongensis]
MNQRITRCMLAAALIACSSLAQAQWIWVNEKGVKQLSDQPPPPGTPANRVLKSPRGLAPADARQAAAPAPAAEGEDAAAPADAKAPAAKPSLAERNADYNKRQKLAAENAAKAQEDANRANEKTKYCSEAKKNIDLLESGVRISEVDNKGERGYMSDEGRAKRLQEDRSAYNKACK